MWTAFAVALAFGSLSLPACAKSYAGVPLAAGAADPELQSLARRAKSGDKRAQLELGTRYEEGRGVTPNRKRAERLYRSAAMQIGGVRMAYVPAAGKNGRGATVPISGGRLVPGLPEAAARLAALQRGKRLETATVAEDRSFFPKGGPDLGRSALTDEIFATIVRIELFSDSCFPVQGQSEDLEIYADNAWNCILRSEPPKDCTQSSDAVLRSIRFVRFNENFTILQRSALGLIERCVAEQRRSMDDVYTRRHWANFLDLIVNDSGHAAPDQRRLIDKFLSSYETHAPRHPPILQFAETMCSRLVAGASPQPVSFWLLYCNSENLNFISRAERNRLIDNSIMKRGVNGFAN